MYLAFGIFLQLIGYRYSNFRESCHICQSTTKQIKTRLHTFKSSQIIMQYSSTDLLLIGICRLFALWQPRNVSLNVLVKYADTNTLRLYLNKLQAFKHRRTRTQSRVAVKYFICHYPVKIPSLQPIPPFISIPQVHNNRSLYFHTFI